MDIYTVTNNDFLEQLKPKNGPVGVETFDSYKERVSQLLPRWPDCPLEQWLYRHSSLAVCDYGWLEFQNMIFTRTTWIKEKIYSDINTHKMERVVDDLGANITETSPDMRSWLQEYMLNNYTWPVPIILLNNPDELVNPQGDRLGQPYHLLEGHLRLGYFRHLYRRDISTLLDQHDVWIVRLEE